MSREPPDRTACISSSKLSTEFQLKFVDLKIYTANVFTKKNDPQLKIVAEAEKTVTELFKTKVNPMFVFHSLFHTQQVVKATG